MPYELLRRIDGLERLYVKMFLRLPIVPSAATPEERQSLLTRAIFTGIALAPRLRERP